MEFSLTRRGIGENGIRTSPPWTFPPKVDQLFIHSFIHLFFPFLYRPFKSSTTQRRSRLQHGYCIGVSCRGAQATVGEGLAQGPYVTARAGVEPTTLRLKVIDTTKAPSRPTCTRSNSKHIIEKEK